MNVLVAENDKCTRDQAVIGLENFGSFSIDTAKGMSAIEMIRQKDYEFVLVGINPGDADGQDLIEAIREKKSNLDIIVLTGEIIAKNMSREKVHSHIFAFIQKPIDPVLFHRTVNRLKMRIMDRN